MIIGLVFAMEEEAKQVLNMYNLVGSSQRDKLSYYVNKESEPNVLIAAISGVGKVNAQIATSKLISQGVEYIMNIGTCGCTGNLYKPGELVIPDTFYDGDLDLSMFGNNTKDPAKVNDTTKEPKCKCYTYSTFVTDDRAKDGIVDMEAYAIVAQAKSRNIPVTIIKVVSDGGDVDEFEGNVDSVITKHLDRIYDIIEDYNK